MYICNRCGCSAMSEIKKNLVCLNCGNEQKKALSRKRGSCAPVVHKHNAQTKKHVDAKMTRQTVKVTQTEIPFKQKKQKKKKGPLAKVITVIIIAFLMVNIVLPLIYGVVSEIAERVSGSYATQSTDDVYEDWIIDSADDPENYVYLEQTPWFYINSRGSFQFDDYAYFAEGNEEKNLVVPTELNGWQVTEIGYDAFLFCEGITSVTVPEGVGVIESDAFYGCYDLEEIWLPTTITHIYDDAVYACDELQAIYFAGTQEQWDAIEIETPNDQLFDLVICLGD